MIRRAKRHYSTSKMFIAPFMPPLLSSDFVRSIEIMTFHVLVLETVPSTVFTVCARSFSISTWQMLCWHISNRVRYPKSKMTYWNSNKSPDVFREFIAKSNHVLVCQFVFDIVCMYEGDGSGDGDREQRRRAHLSVRLPILHIEWDYSIEAIHSNVKAASIILTSSIVWQTMARKISAPSTKNYYHKFT